NQSACKLMYSTVGLGHPQHLHGEPLRQRHLMKTQAVSYRTSGEVVGALLRGDTAFAVELYPPIRGQVDSGDLRLIVVATLNRWPGLENVPALAESGVPGVAYRRW